MAMSAELKILRVFLSSPGDVPDARLAIQHVVERELAKEPPFEDVKLEVVSWDDPYARIPMDAYLTPQEAVKRGLPRPSECDVVVVLFWSRMGTAQTHDGTQYLSGTDYEYQDAINANPKPRVLVYRCTAPLEQASTLGESVDQQREQYRRLESFFARFRGDDGSPRGSFETFATTQELRERAKMVLRRVLYEKLEKIKSFAPPDLGTALRFRTTIQAFRDEYLVSETGRVPFGGRDHELEQLDKWLLDAAAPSRMLVTSPAGRGKSALLVRWMASLQEMDVIGKERWQLAFMPISIRFQTNRPEVFNEGLALRLAEITGEALPSTSSRDANFFRAAVRDQLGIIAEKKVSVVVVLDGLDEALQGSFDVSMFPPVLPPTLRILVSARRQVGDKGALGWLKLLGWERGTKVETLELEKLDLKGISDVLVKLGAPMEVVANESDLINRLLLLTEGEPLLVRYYAEDLWQLRRSGAQITRADLETLKPGFDSYFQRWLEHQERLWKEEGEGIDAQKVDRVLLLLAFALGPLQQADLVTLMKEVHDEPGLVVPDRLLRPLRRFVLGDGKDSGFVLSHPKIGDYLRSERFHTVERVIDRAFAAWGLRHVTGLNSAPPLVLPQEASSYVLQFLPRHLEIVEAPPSDFLLLLEDGWRRAWEHLDGGDRGFASSVRAIWHAIRKHGELNHLGSQWRCALTLASLKNVGRNTPAALIKAAVAKQELTPRQGAHLAELKGVSEPSSFFDDAEDGVQTLAEIAVLACNNAALATELALSAVSMAIGARDEDRRLQFVEKLSQVLLAEGAIARTGVDAVRGAIIGAARSLQDLEHRTMALCSIAEVVGPAYKASLVIEARQTAQAIGPEKKRAAAFIRLLPLVEHTLKSGLAELTIQAIAAINDDYEQANCLAVSKLNCNSR